MTKILSTIGVIGFLTASSCTKVVQIDLNKSNPKYVVEAEITNTDSFQTVHITRTVNFSDLNSYPAVTNAIVVISDNTGNSDTLAQGEPGFYKTSKIKGVPGRKYDLLILVDGRQFTANSTMPEPVVIDSLKAIDQMSFGKEIKSLKVTFMDDVTSDNYYYLMVYRNHQRLKSIYIDNDQSLNGIAFTRILPDMDSTYHSGDKVCVDLRSISKEVYDYYFSLQQTIGQSSATPANPVTNIKGNDVLGYFSAHTADRRKLIVP